MIDKHKQTGWAVFSRADDLYASDQMYQLLRSHNITPKEFLTYGDNRTFLTSQLIDTTSTVAFHRGNLVGTYDSVKLYLEESNEDHPL